MSDSFYLAANWKMHLTRAEALELFRGFAQMVEQSTAPRVEVWVAAPATQLGTLGDEQSAHIRIGSQNIHPEPSGAFTGEISAPMLKDCGGTFSLIGHSERRSLFHENEELLGKRAEGALQQDVQVIYCVGETLQERQGGKTDSVLQHQLSTISKLLEKYPEKILIAYEPVWAIGTGKVASIEEIASAHRVIKEIASQSGAKSLPVLYGGSVKPQNIETIAGLPEVNGALVGGASLELDSFRELYDCAVKLYQ